MRLQLLAAWVVLSVALTRNGAADTPASIDLTASAHNVSPDFNKYLYTFPLAGPAILTGFSGSVAMRSQGQNFAEALISVHVLPPGARFPRDGEMVPTYPELSKRYPVMGNLLNLIVKMPSGRTASTLPVQIAFPAGVRVEGRLLLVLDGSVLISGGDFTMTSGLVAHLAPVASEPRPAKVVTLDDEFCFGRAGGGEIATVKTSPDAAMMGVTPIAEDGELIGLYGDVSDSAFGPAFAGPVGPGPWAISNDYYLYPRAALARGQHGPDDFYAKIPADATRLYSLPLPGTGQVSLQQVVVHPVAGIQVHRGDCLVHLIHMTAASDQGGIDAENQVYALVRPRPVK